MKARIFKFLDELRSNYWFIPSLMAVGAIVLSVMTVRLDERIKTDWPEQIPWVYSSKPDGARAVLATVAGSMITVAGVTFSLTLLAVSHTTAQFGPRLLTNFMRDRGNQVTLGTFIATFLYCLLVLRTVRTAEEATGDVAAVGLTGAFVPHISITVALALTLCSVGILIYFFHHVPESMDLSNVVAKVGRQLADGVDEMFPEMIGHDAPQAVNNPRDDVPQDEPTRTISIGDRRDGYVQAMNEDGLLKIAIEHDLVIRLHFRPGDFISRGQTAFTVAPAERVNDEIARSLQSCIALGEARTPHQNLLFLVDQMVEIAARALSPGVNDPFTGIICMRWLGSALTLVGGRHDPEPHRYDDEARLRFIAQSLTFNEIADTIFDQLRPYFAADRNAALQMMQTLAVIRDSVTSEDRRERLDEHADRLMDAVKLVPLTEHDLALMRAADGRTDESDERGPERPSGDV